MEAASLAWRPLGWECAFVSEIEKAPCALLAQRLPDVPNHGDMTKFQDWPDHAIDLLVGGTPCQSFSVAGLRKGLADPRGSLMLTYGAIAKRYRPAWLLWENVPGVLSSDGGRDFGSFLGMLAELGYGFAYRVLDAQFFGLAQRRARVFVVGYLGDWRPPAAVLFESESLRGDSAPRRSAGQNIAGALTGSIGRRGGQPSGGDIDGQLVAHSLRADGFDASEDGTGRGTPLVPVMAFDARQSDVIQYGDLAGPLDTDGQSVGVLAFSCKDHGADAANDVAPTMRAMGHADSHANAGGQLAVAFAQNSRSEVRELGGDGQIVGAIAAEPGAQQQTYIATQWAVRRLTPRECERLQGAPDDHTLVTYRGKPMADGPRYKMIGNSFAANCVNWIGERIDLVRGIISEQPA